MNIIRKITLKYLIKNKTRTLVTIIGVMLATSLITAIVLMGNSLYKYAIENIKFYNGDWHGNYLNANFNEKEKISSYEEIESFLYYEKLGHIKLDNSSDKGYYKNNNIFSEIIGCSEENFKKDSLRLTQGRYPSNQNEIVISEMFLEVACGTGIKLGDEISVEYGNEYEIKYYAYENGVDENVTTYIDLDDEKTRENINVYNYSIENIKFNEPKIKKMKIVGFVSNELDYYSSIFTLSQNKSSSSYDIYFKLYKPDKVSEFMFNNNIVGEINNELLLLTGDLGYDFIHGLIFGFLAIVFLIVILGSAGLIYNSFYISITERRKEFGLLSSIGTTKKQIGRSVFWEAFFVGGVGIALGILLGITGIGTTLYLLEDHILNITDNGIKITLVFDYNILFISLLLSAITILISALFPMIKIKKISPIESIRQNLDIKKTRKKIKTSKIIFKLFGISGLLGRKYYKRNKKMYRSTIASIVISLVLFVSVNYFMKSLVYEFENYRNDYGYGGSDIQYQTDNQEYGRIIYDEFKNNNEVTKSYYLLESFVVIDNNLKNLTNEYKQGIHVDNEYQENEEVGKQVVLLYICEDDVFNEIIEENSIDKEKYYDLKKPVSLVYNVFSEMDYESGEISKFEILKDENTRVNYYYLNTDYESEQEDKKYEMIEKGELALGDNINKLPDIMNGNQFTYLTLIFPMSQIKNVEKLVNETIVCRVYFYSDNPDKTFFSIKNHLMDNGYSTYSLYNNSKEIIAIKSSLDIFKVFLYGFIIIIALIGIANIFNTIFTNINLRKKEFAVLKSIGMTKKDFYKIMNYECIFYGIRAVLIGVPLASVSSYGIYRVLFSKMKMSYEYPIGSILTGVACVFLVVFVSMIYSSRKLKINNPIESIRM